MITKKEVKEILAVIGSEDCRIVITVQTVDGHFKMSKRFTNSDEALEWVVDDLDSKDKLIITIT